MIYHIYTEDKPDLYYLASIYLEGFTLTKGIGYWKGQYEPCAIIEVINGNKWDVYCLAEAIKTSNKQEAVLVTATELHSNMMV